eukprot:scaffold681553_cov45-Prasinocladus_malaysianus.AAC.1
MPRGPITNSPARPSTVLRRVVRVLSNSCPELPMASSAVPPDWLWATNSSQLSTSLAEPARSHCFQECIQWARANSG